MKELVKKIVGVGISGTVFFVLSLLIPFYVTFRVTEAIDISDLGTIITLVLLMFISIVLIGFVRKKVGYLDNYFSYLGPALVSVLLAYLFSYEW